MLKELEGYKELEEHVDVDDPSQQVEKPSSESLEGEKEGNGK